MKKKAIRYRLSLGCSCGASLVTSVLHDERDLVVTSFWLSHPCRNRSPAQERLANVTYGLMTIPQVV